jgi:hypothetical protein
MRIAIVEANTVVNIVVATSAANVHVADNQVAVPAPDDADIGWAVVDGVLRLPQPPTMTAPELRALAALQRYDVEVGGCEWGDHVINTDRDSQSKLIAEMVAIGAGLRQSASPWKMRHGFVALSNDDMMSVIAAARGHIAAAFAAEAAVVTGIDNGTITTVAQIREANWPTTPSQSLGGV